MASKTPYPTSDAKFNTWFKKFASAYSKNWKKLGYSSKDYNYFRNFYSNWVGFNSMYSSYKSYAKGWSPAQKFFVNNAKAWVSSFYKSVSKNPYFTPSMASQFGFTYPSSSTSGRTNGYSSGTPKRSRTKSRRSVSKPATSFPYPNMTFDWGRNGQVTIGYSGPYKYRGSSTSGFSWKNVWVQFRVNGGRWQSLHKGSKWPFVHFVGKSNWKTIEYRAAYYKGSSHGPWRTWSFKYTKSKAA